MSRTSHVRLMASYNEWMNTRLYAAAATLPAAALAADRKAFFGSILGTLSHIINIDILWLKRYARHPARYPALARVAQLPDAAWLGELRAPDLEGLVAQRRWLDAVLIALADEVSEDDLDYALPYTSLDGEPSQRNFFSLLMDLFNHQTHHRGQVTTLLSQEGVDMGATDLVDLVANEI